MAGVIRSATLEDAAAIQAIYAPYVTGSMISFETKAPTVEEMAGRIQKVTAKYPWLVYAIYNSSSSEQIGGYVYASTHREREAYQWSVDVTVYINPAFQRRNDQSDYVPSVSFVTPRGGAPAPVRSTTSALRNARLPPPTVATTRFQRA